MIGRCARGRVASSWRGRGSARLEGGGGSRMAAMSEKFNAMGQHVYADADADAEKVKQSNRAL